jgi:hypothetical protein
MQTPSQSLDFHLMTRLKMGILSLKPSHLYVPNRNQAKTPCKWFMGRRGNVAASFNRGPRSPYERRRRLEDFERRRASDGTDLGTTPCQPSAPSPRDCNERPHRPHSAGLDDAAGQKSNPSAKGSGFPAKPRDVMRHEEEGLRQILRFRLV